MHHLVTTEIHNIMKKVHGPNIDISQFAFLDEYTNLIFLPVFLKLVLNSLYQIEHPVYLCEQKNYSR